MNKETILYQFYVATLKKMEVLSVIHHPCTILKSKIFCISSQHSQHRESPPHRQFSRKIVLQWKKDECVNLHDSNKNYSATIHSLSMKKLPLVAQELVYEMKSKGVLPDSSTLSALMLCYANNGLFHEAQQLFDEILNSSFVLNVETISQLFDACCRYEKFNDVSKIIDQLSFRHPHLLPKIYQMAICCFGKNGHLHLMESTLIKMVSKGFLVDSSTGNALMVYYSEFGSLTELETAYNRLKRSRILIEEEGVRAISSFYIKRKEFYKLGEFVRDVGLGRRNMGNLLWNILLLSYAVNFKMKSLQREFLRMVGMGFNPDINTFNIRLMAFSKMALFWDLHLSLEHMKHEGVVPDLVTYGCVVDAYLDRRMGKNIGFALSKMNGGDLPVVVSDPILFEAMGKGDFHLNSEVILEYNKKNWTYKKLINVYLKKRYRSNQVFWNY